MDTTTTPPHPLTQREKIITLLVFFLIRLLNKSEPIYSLNENLKEITAELKTGTPTSAPPPSEHNP